MADVLLICMRTDADRARVLADLFEAAGFGIGGAPRRYEALVPGATAIIVWSPAAEASDVFMHAARRVAAARQAVFAQLAEGEPHVAFGGLPTFDLSRWSGDPDDCALDPLLYAVHDRVAANRARAARLIGAPPYARTVAEPTQQGDLLVQVAEWRVASRADSPGGYRAYLDRYGDNGFFSEIAELRLQRTRSPPPAPERVRLSAVAWEPPPRRARLRPVAYAAMSAAAMVALAFTALQTLPEAFASLTAAPLSAEEAPAWTELAPPAEIPMPVQTAPVEAAVESVPVSWTPPEAPRAVAAARMNVAPLLVLPMAEPSQAQLASLSDVPSFGAP